MAESSGRNDIPYNQLGFKIDLYYVLTIYGWIYG